MKAFDDALGAQVEDAPARTIAFADLVGNDEQIADLQLSVTEVGNAAGGSVSIQDGAIRFEAAADFAGTAGFDYLVTDGAGGEDVGRASFNVTPVEESRSPSTTAWRTWPRTRLPSGSIPSSSCAMISTRMAAGDRMKATSSSPSSPTSSAARSARSFSPPTSRTSSTSGYLFTPAKDFHGTAGFDYEIADLSNNRAVAHVSFEICGRQ